VKLSWTVIDPCWAVIEGDGKAALYTGDIRSEPWFVSSITRNPTIVEYSSGLRTLDTIYLDTSFTDNVPFQTKADGIQELLHKVMAYPSDTVFHFQAWTYGYEDVWIALAKALQSRVSIQWNPRARHRANWLPDPCR
jgi:DNA cross-link repair 1C protein